MPKLRGFSGAELCNFLSEHGFERVRQRGSHSIMRRGQVSFPVPCIATSTAARYVELFVKVDFPGRSSNSL
jgi:predicted RNA binding protein YcfA (HicA-like mRNA interferase family)